MSGCFGRGRAIGHAGELLQGANRVEPFLVTLPAPIFQSEAIVRRASAWSIAPPWKMKALRAAQAAWVAWGFDGALAVTIESGIPIARGCGSSTADCVAAIRSVAAFVGRRCDAPEIARFAQAAEGASDSTMFDLEPMAFLPRCGKLLTRFEAPWPAMHVSVLDLGGPNVETLDCPPPAYTEDELSEFEWLLSELCAAFREEDVAKLGFVASRSAAIHQRHRPHRHWQTLFDKAMTAGAMGVALAHSGTVAAVLSTRAIQIPGAAHYTLGCAGEGASHANLVGRRRQP